MSISDKKIDTNMIANVKFCHEIVDLLFNGKREVYKIARKTNDVIALPKNQMLASCFGKKCLILYDQDIKQIRVISSINGKEFDPIKATCNFEEKKLYIVDFENDKVLMTDLEFNLIKSFGSSGSEDNQIQAPFDLCLINNNLYLSDTGNKRIKIFSTDLELLNSLKVNFEPLQIKGLNSIFAVQTEPQIYFYKLSDLSFIRQYDNNFSVISSINSNIYGLNCTTKKLYCYDDKANLIEETTFDYEYLIDGLDGRLVILNGELFMYSDTKNSIIKFSKQL